MAPRWDWQIEWKPDAWLQFSFFNPPREITHSPRLQFQAPPPPRQRHFLNGTGECFFVTIFWTGFTHYIEGVCTWTTRPRSKIVKCQREKLSSVRWKGKWLELASAVSIDVPAICTCEKVLSAGDVWAVRLVAPVIAVRLPVALPLGWDTGPRRGARKLRRLTATGCAGRALLLIRPVGAVPVAVAAVNFPHTLPSVVAAELRGAAGGGRAVVLVAVVEAVVVAVALPRKRNAPAWCAGELEVLAGLFLAEISLIRAFKERKKNEKTTRM